LAPLPSQRKYIKTEQIEKLAKRIYYQNGMGINIFDLQRECGISKSQAQRRLKHFHFKKILFTAKDLEDQYITIKGIGRENP
jgi:hypothetical protein